MIPGHYILLGSAVSLWSLKPLLTGWGFRCRKTVLMERREGSGVHWRPHLAPYEWREHSLNSVTGLYVVKRGRGVCVWKLTASSHPSQDVSKQNHILYKWLYFVILMSLPLLKTPQPPSTPLNPCSECWARKGSKEPSTSVSIWTTSDQEVFRPRHQGSYPLPEKGPHMLKMRP